MTSKLNDAWLRTRIRLLTPVYKAASRVLSVYDVLCDELAQRESVSVGTKVLITCNQGCGNDIGGTNYVWTIERFNLDANDYYLETTKRPDDGFKRDGKHFTYLRRECFEIVEG